MDKPVRTRLRRISPFASHFRSIPSGTNTAVKSERSKTEAPTGTFTMQIASTRRRGSQTPYPHATIPTKKATESTATLIGANESFIFPHPDRPIVPHSGPSGHQGSRARREARIHAANFGEEWYTVVSVRAEPGVSSNSPNQARFCQWSLRFIQRNSIQETRAKWNKAL